MIPATLSECMRPASVFAVNLAGDSMFRIEPPEARKVTQGTAKMQVPARGEPRALLTG